MHKLAKEIMDRIKSKINASGIDGITEQELIEMKYWACVADAMTSYDYHFKIIEEMEKPENQYGKNYDENGKYYTQPRRANGQYMRGYDEMYDMTPRYNEGKMYYNGSNMNHSSRYDMARRGYEEAKMNHPEESNMDKMQDIFEVLKGDMKELKNHMTPQEKTYARNELTNMVNSLM